MKMYVFFCFCHYNYSRLNIKQIKVYVPNFITSITQPKPSPYEEEEQFFKNIDSNRKLIFYYDKVKETNFPSTKKDKISHSLST